MEQPDVPGALRLADEAGLECPLEVDETEEQLAAFRFLPVKPIARVALAPRNLDALIQTLENARREYEGFKPDLSDEDS
jgi:hypothetical protein